MLASSVSHNRPRQTVPATAGPSASGLSDPAHPSATRRDRPLAVRQLTDAAPRPIAGSSRARATPIADRAQHVDPVRSAQEEATTVWRADLRRLLERAEERFADVCWTSAAQGARTQSDTDTDSEFGHVTSPDLESTGHGSPLSGNHAATQSAGAAPLSSVQDDTVPSSALIWAHKAILYARAPNTFQTRFLHLRTPAAQLQHIGSSASLVSLPLHKSESQLSLASNVSSSTQTGAPPNQSAAAAYTNNMSVRSVATTKARKSMRGTAPPSSFSMTKPSLRKPISRSSISRPLRRPSVDEASSVASGFLTSDSEGEGGPVTSLRASRLINARPPSANGPASLTSPSKLSQTSSSAHDSSAPARKSSFASVASTVESRLTDPRSVVSDASALKTPISLGGVSQAFFEATLQYLYTGEESMVDAFEFLFEDRLASDFEATPEDKLDKLRSDLTFMWRSKLYSDVKIVLDDDDDSDHKDDAGLSGAAQQRAGGTRMVDIPDANMSVLSLPQTMDTDRLGESDAEDDELTSFSAHRMILASRSQYFASLLLSPYADARNALLRLPSPPFTPASLHFTLGFLYTGTLFFSNRTFDLSTAFSLWRGSTYLQVESLRALVVALIDREFCHGFGCSPPCRKCVKRVPRTLAFATSPDVSEQALQEPAIGAVSGPHFGMYWGKDVGNLDPMLQDRIVDAISDRLKQDPTLVVSVLRQLCIVGQKIDTERSSRWVESLRLMAETVENRLMSILHDNLTTIVQSQAWSDLLDGVGSLSDVLEKSLVMLIDGLTEARAAQTYQTLVGQVLLREQGFEVLQSRQAVENARASILRYLKKRWINVRALAGFNKLEKWCLKELADELDVATADLVTPEEAPARVATPPNRLVVGRRTMPTAGAASASPRSRSSLAAATPANPSRLRTASASSLTTTVAASPSSARKVQHDEGERAPGPIHMRAAVLNRNAARVSATNGHRPLSPASTASKASTASPSVRQARLADTASVATTMAANPRLGGANGAAAKPPTSASITAGKQRSRTTSSSSSASTASASARAANSKSSPAAARQSLLTTTPKVGSSDTAKTHPLPPATTSTADEATTPKRSATQLPIADADKTPTKTVKATRSAISLSSGTSNPTLAAPPLPSSVDVAGAKAKPQPKAPVLGTKSSFLRATPGPGGTFSLSSTESGRDLRARTLSSGSESRKSGAEARSTTPPSTGGRRSVTPTRATRNMSTGSNGSAKSGAEAMPQNALHNVRRAQQIAPIKPRNEQPHEPGSSRDIYPQTTARSQELVAERGTSLLVGIACIVSLPLGPARSTAMAKDNLHAHVERKSGSAGAGAGARKKFRALVRYLGPVSGYQGVWVGVQLDFPTAEVDLVAHSASNAVLRLEEGCLHGTRYFHSPPAANTSATRHAAAPSLPESNLQQTAPDKEPQTESAIQLLVRPADVVWVVQ